MVLLENPKCPQCGSKSQKAGKITTKTEKKQRYKCINCGTTYYAYRHKDFKGSL